MRSGGERAGETAPLVRRRDRRAPRRACRDSARARARSTSQRDVPLRAGIFTDDLAQFIAEDVDVVVEAIGGSDVAGVIARAALGRGTRLITANKELVASAGAALAAIGRDAGAALDFGAAVGGSVPVIATLRDLLGTSRPSYVRGILNGTSNYVLSLLERGSDYPTALAAACRRGLAEADCTRDMDGSDTAAKLAIIAWVSFGVDPSTVLARRTGLLPDPARLVRHAAALGGRMRLLGECAHVADDGIACAVEPVIVSLENPFARTELEDNRVEVGLGWSGPLAVSGPGAGGAPTATSLLSDLLSSGDRAEDRAAHPIVTVDDPRPHSWLVAGRVAASSLARTVANSGIPIQSVGGKAGDSHVVTRPVSWAAVQPVIAELTASNADPLIARVELTVVGERHLMSLALARTIPRSRRHASPALPAFEITGPAQAPVVAVLGGISSSRHVTSTDDDSSAGWWQQVVRRGGLIDTRRCRVISIDYLTDVAHGGPVRTSDQADALASALDAAGVDRLHAVVGASYGGMVALAFGAAYPDRVGRLVVISAAHASDPAATALRVLQRRVVELGIGSGCPAQAVSIARGIAMTSYGTPAEFRARFAGEEGHDGDACSRIEEHLLAAGERFARTCSPARFLALSRSLDLHFVRPEDVRVPTALVSVREDQLVPPSQSRELAARLGAPCALIELESIHGHDAFLDDPSLLAPVLAAALSTSSGSTS